MSIYIAMYERISPRWVNETKMKERKKSAKLNRKSEGSHEWNENKYSEWWIKNKSNNNHVDKLSKTMPSSSSEVKREN